MNAQEQRVVDTLKAAYRALSSPYIRGLEELGYAIGNALCEVWGTESFVNWLKSLAKDSSYESSEKEEP